mgnify:CR=1 FL=1
MPHSIPIAVNSALLPCSRIHTQFGIWGMKVGKRDEFASRRKLGRLRATCSLSSRAGSLGLAGKTSCAARTADPNSTADLLPTRAQHRGRARQRPDGVEIVSNRCAPCGTVCLHLALSVGDNRAERLAELLHDRARSPHPPGDSIAVTAAAGDWCEELQPQRLCAGPASSAAASSALLTRSSRVRHRDRRCRVVGCSRRAAPSSSEE